MRVGAKRMIWVLLAGAAFSPAMAQDAAPPVTPAPAPAPAENPAPAEAPAEGEDGEPAIVVTGQRLRGSVVGDVEPEQRLNEQQIRGYGAANVGELIEALAPQTRSGRGRGQGQPIVLLNGRRIAGFGEIRDLPPEAIERVDVLPEEVALSYGYRADQRVVNIVLKERFSAVTTAANLAAPTAGGRVAVDTNVNILKIDRAGRWSVDAQYQRGGALLESDRDLIQSAPSQPFDLIGNVGAAPFAPGAEVDPALSAAAGALVTIAAVPSSAATGAPSLGAFVPGANAPRRTDLGRYRTLVPQTEAINLNGTLNRTLFGNVSATVNARFGATSSESRLGLPSLALLLPETNPFSPFSRDVTLLRYSDAAGPLLRESDGTTWHGGLALNGDISTWRWTFTANYDLARTATVTDRGADPAGLQARLAAGDPAFNPFGPVGGDLLVLRPEDRARSTARSADAEAVFNGTLLRLPAGPVITSFRIGGDTRSIQSETLRSGVIQSADLGRDRGAVQGSFDLPLTSRREGVLDAIGNVALNLNFEVEHLSDFGTLRTIGYGLRWEPIEAVDLALTINDEDGAPTMQQLGDPVLLTPNARTFDFTRQETVDVSRIEGGNPALVADHRRVLAARIGLRPITGTNLSFIANYTRTRIDNPIAAFPIATAEIEAAFPDRFVRDAAGRLVQIDARPVNYARSDREELRWGVNFMQPIGAQGGPPGAGGPDGRRPGAGGPGGSRGSWRGPRADGGGGGGGRRAGAGGGGRRGGPGSMMGGPGGGLQLSFYHTWRFTDEVLIRPGVPELDFLNGSAFGARGGRPRHELELQAGIFRNGLGAWLNTTWQSATFVRGAAAPQGGAGGDLAFSDIATLNLNLFADLGQQRSLVRRNRWLRGTRVTFGVSNLLDSRVRVRDENGTTPIGYQPDYLDPLGRTIRIGLRKLF
jgi:iron complex outermembrane receptor protein